MFIISNFLPKLERVSPFLSLPFSFFPYNFLLRRGQQPDFILQMQKKIIFLVPLCLCIVQTTIPLIPISTTFFFFLSQLNTWKASRDLGLLHSLLSWAAGTVIAIYNLWDQSTKLIALKHYHWYHQEPLEVITWILWPNERKKKRRSDLHWEFCLFS